MRVFNKFRAELNYTGSATTDQIAQFIAWLSLQQKAPATIKLYISAVSFWHKMGGQNDPTDCFVVHKLLCGVSRSGRSPDARMPITSQILQRLLSALPAVTNSSYERVMYAAAFTLAFYGFLRLGEFTSRSKREPGGLGPNDVGLRRSRAGVVLQVLIKRCKNNQYGKPQTIMIAAIPNCVLCPVQNMQAYMAVRPRDPCGFFCHFNSAVLTRHEMQATLRRAVNFVGLSKNITTHSFRIGAATAAAAAGCSDEDIKAFGRWRSGAYARYIRLPPLVPSARIASSVA